jgi:hypothetical protein
MMTPSAGSRRSTFKDFPGLVNNADRRDLPPGAATVQVNLGSRQHGNLKSRKGLAPLSFEKTTVTGVGSVVV